LSNPEAGLTAKSVSLIWWRH